jgi:alanine-synthesizing transaminase
LSSIFTRSSDSTGTGSALERFPLQPFVLSSIFTRSGDSTGTGSALRSAPFFHWTKPMTEEFHRIRRLPPYVFAEVNAAKAKARAMAEDIVDLGMGNPDSPTPPHIVAKLIEAVQDPRTHRYSMSKGIPGLRRACAGYYERRFGVKLDPETEVVATLGSKEGLANLAQAISSPGDTILVPNPSYPIHQFGFIIAGASVRSIPYTPDDEMLRALDRAVRHSVPKPTAVIVNFPSNPTALVASIEFYRELVAFCRKHELFILSDLAYAELYFGATPPPSVLEVPGAKEVTVEFTSMSKTYNMPGWRMGFAVGNPKLVAALARVKSYLDYGAFTPIQVAAAAALNGPQDCVAEMRALYRDRRDVLVKGLRQAGWEVPSIEGSMFLWAPIPEKFRHLGSVGFSKLLLEKSKVAVAPGLGFGEHGDGHVRIALVENNHRIRQALRGIRSFLQGDNAGPVEAEPELVTQ